MMKVGGMWVFMSNGIMSVKVRMRFQNRTLMRVPVVIIVNVQMVVLDRLVGVSVAVSFPNEKEYTGYHEDHSHRFQPRRQRAKDRHRE